MTLSPLVLPLANAGTPLIWATFLWLVVGNAIIGVVEGWVFRRWTGLRRGEKPWLIPSVIAVNYASAIAGLFAIKAFTGRSSWFERMAIESPLTATVAGFAVMLVVSLLIEVPIVCAAFRVRRGLLVYVLGNIVTNLVCLWLGWSLSLNNVNDWKRPPVGERPTLAGYAITYTGPDGQPRRVELGPFAPGDPTTSRELIEGNGHPFFAEVLQTRPGRYDRVTDYTYYLYFNPSKNSDAKWHRLAAEVPFAHPGRSFITLLDRDLTLCQFGPWIAILDPNSKTIYRLAEGSKPKAYLYTIPPTTAPSTRRSP